MYRRVQIVSRVAALTIIVAGLVVVLMQQKPLVYGHYTNLEAYPHYYYTNFTIDDVDEDTALVTDLSINRAGSLVDCYLWQQIYHLTLHEFEMYFDIIIANDPDSDRVINPRSSCVNTYNGPSHIESTIREGEYVYVFWVVTSEPVYGWSASLTLRTDTLQIHSTFS